MGLKALSALSGGVAFDPAAPGAIGGTTPAAITGTVVTATTSLVTSAAAGGLSALPLQIGAANYGFIRGGGATFGIVQNGVVTHDFANGSIYVAANGQGITLNDSNISRISAGLLGIGTGSSASFAGSLKLTDLFTNNAAALIKTNTALTDGVGASAGTITNAPSVGNPTKWLPVSDNGTIRMVPSW